MKPKTLLSGAVILSVLLAGPIGAAANTLPCPSELHFPCGEKSLCIGCWVQVYEQLKEGPEPATFEVVELATSHFERSVELVRRGVTLLGFVVCLFQELSRELIESTLSLEKGNRECSSS